jgi:hypothetical protein
MANEDGSGPVDKGKAKVVDPPKKDDVVMKDANTKDAKGEPKEGGMISDTVPRGEM